MIMKQYFDLYIHCLLCSLLNHNICAAIEPRNDEDFGEAAPQTNDEKWHCVTASIKDDDSSGRSNLWSIFKCNLSSMSTKTVALPPLKSRHWPIINEELGPQSLRQARHIILTQAPNAASPEKSEKSDADDDHGISGDARDRTTFALQTWGMSRQRSVLPSQNSSPLLIQEAIMLLHLGT